MTDRAELEALLGRVEKLTGPDRKVDADLTAMLLNANIVWHTDRITGERYPEALMQSDITADGLLNPPVHRYTASLDAAVALVERCLPGWRIDLRIGKWPEHDPRHVVLWNNDTTAVTSVFGVKADGASPAIALLSAALRAMQQGKEG